MSETLSSLIAFVGFLIVFSMLVQSVQEAIKGFLKLKTGVWESFFVSLYRKEFSLNPETGSKIKEFLRRITSGGFVGDFDKRFQRLNKIVGEADRLIKILRADLRSIGGPEQAVPLLSRTEELTDVIRQISGLKLDSLLEIYDAANNNIIRNFSEELNNFSNQYSNIRNILTASDLIANSAFRQKCNDLLNRTDDMERIISDYRLQIESKIDSWLTQLEDNYRQSMLKWTVLIGCFFVLAFNADAFSIFKYLNIDSKSKAALIEKTAESTSKTLKSKPEDLNTLDNFLKTGKLSEARNKVIDFSKNLAEDFTTYGAAGKAEEARKIMEASAGIDISQKDNQAKDSLKNKTGELSKLYVGLQKKTMDYQIENLAALDLPLGWTSDWKQLKAEFRSSNNNSFTDLLLKKLGGLALTTFLITFGAPFWNDVLSALVGLKNMTLKGK